MRLTVDDETVDRPTAADIARLVPDRPPNELFSLALGDDDGSLEADAAGADTYEVSFIENRRLWIAGRTIGGAELRPILELYLARNPDWRKRLSWSPWQPDETAKSKASPSWDNPTGPWIVILPVAAVAAVAGLLYGMGWLLRTTSQIPLPAMIDSQPARIALGFFAVCVLVVLGALIVKLIETRRAARWPRVMGRVVTSEERYGSTEVQTSVSTDPPGRRAHVVYEYQVGDETLRASRVTLAERTSEDEVPDILKRYPVGKVVPVYHDPADPGSAVLDRTMPQGTALGCLALLAIGGVALAVAMLAATQGPAFIQSHFPRSVPPLVLFFGVLGIFVLIAAATVQKGINAAHRWPKATGRIVSSTITTGRRGPHHPLVSFEYQVRGKTYTSGQIRLESKVGGSKSFAQRRADRYPKGRTVTVFYDPENPARAALELPHLTGWVMFAAAAAFLLIAALSTGAWIGD